MNSTSPSPVNGDEREARIASLLLRVGLVACVLAIVPSRLTGIGLCNAPKELVFETVGLLSAALCLVRGYRYRIDYVDLLLAAFLAFSLMSSAFAAIDGWEALRAVGISLAGAAVFWSSRSLGNRGQRQPLLDSAALAVVLAATTVVLDALGLTDGLSITRPGGTLGNRNSAAHFIAIGVPLLILQTFTKGTVRRERFALSGLVIAGAALLLTRSRAAWLALLPGAFLPLALLGWTSRGLTINRIMRPVGALIIGLVVGLCMPTRLHWTASHPYVESFESLTESSRGSGRVRLEQYRDSLLMLLDHKTLGVGPGNWKIVYQPHASDRRKRHPQDSASASQGSVERRIWYIPNRLNSDWVGFAVERGLPAVICLVAALAILAAVSAKSLFQPAVPEPDVDRIPPLATLIALVVVAAVVGSLDAVLQLPAPTYLLFLGLGALAPLPPRLFSTSPSGITRALATLTCLLLAGVLAAYTLNEIYVSYLIVRSNSGGLSEAYRISLDKRWFVTEVVWSERAIKKNMGRYPACD